MHAWPWLGYFLTLSDLIFALPCWLKECGKCISGKWSSAQDFSPRHAHIQRRLSAATLLLSELHSHRPGLENTVLKDHMWCFGPNDRLTSESWMELCNDLYKTDGWWFNQYSLAKGWYRNRYDVHIVTVKHCTSVTHLFTFLSFQTCFYYCAVQKMFTKMFD